jgi:hypothetical protein
MRKAFRITPLMVKYLIVIELWGSDAINELQSTLCPYKESNAKFV